MKRFFKYIGITLLTLIGGVILYLLAYLILSNISTKTNLSCSNPAITCYLLSNGIHTDLVVPTKTNLIDWTTTFPTQNTKSNIIKPKYTAIGWGDKGFYLETPTWADLTFATAFKACFGLSKCALHVTYYQEIKISNRCKSFQICTEDYKKLIAFIKKDIVFKDEDLADYISCNAQYGKNDAFYEAKGNYSIFKTCNTWTNQSLQSCGSKAALWTPFEAGVFRNYR
jgi:uncharacterized protein (TIGR02117 family)